MAFQGMEIPAQTGDRGIDIHHVRFLKKKSGDGAIIMRTPPPVESKVCLGQLITF
ncbi:MAG TPA: hypothetical protein VGA56_02755 [Opitutaceae bacterium]